MTGRQQILERWIGSVADAHPEQAAMLRVAEPDPFRNPMAYALRQSLTRLWEQLRGNMDAEVIENALDTLLRIQAVQDVSASEAMDFLVLLRPLLPPLPEADIAILHDRLDRLALAAGEKYRQCREQLAAVRAHEKERSARGHWMRRTRRQA